MSRNISRSYVDTTGQREASRRASELRGEGCSVISYFALRARLAPPLSCAFDSRGRLASRDGIDWCRGYGPQSATLFGEHHTTRWRPQLPFFASYVDLQRMKPTQCRRYPSFSDRRTASSSIAPKHGDCKLHAVEGVGGHS
jgi:hypothetical protein